MYNRIMTAKEVSMIKTAEKKGWNPYVSGGLTGLLIILSVGLTGNYFGASTSVSRTAGMIIKSIAPAHAEGLGYLDIIKPVIDWQWMFLVGIALGSFLSAVTSGSFKLTAIPDLWQSRFGEGSHAKRAIFAFIGGALALFGARIAGGCTSGHGLSGSLQLAVSGLLTLTFFFIGGIATAKIVYRGGK